jgi:hypothetical protein
MRPPVAAGPTLVACPTGARLQAPGRAPTLSCARWGVMRRIVGLALAIGALAIPATAFADPDFGPGNSSKGPNDGGAKCHPPGQTVTEPGCE